MKFRRFVVPASLMTLLATATPALAKPIYLTCFTVENGSREDFDVTVDEDAGTVTVSGGGYSKKYNATFTRDLVQFREVTLFDYTINRTDLSINFTRVTGSVGRGKCQIATPVKRAF